MNYVAPRVLADTISSHAPADDTAAVVTLAAVARRCHVVAWVVWSYDSTPTGGSLTITDGTDTVAFAIASSGPGAMAIPMKFASNTEVTVTLAAGGASVAGSLNVGSFVEGAAPGTA